MTETCVVVSDIHVGDGRREGDQFFERQQAALDGLLAALAPGGALGQTSSLELVLNGDSFDFLLGAPIVPGRGRTDAALGLAKVERVIAAHPLFFAALRRFLDAPDRTLTFTIGNHDLELCFAAVRARLRQAIGAAPGRVRFCLSRAYRPFPDVVLEHGCQFDPWNQIDELWDGFWPLYDLIDDGIAHSADEPESIPLPWGTRYYADVLVPVHQRYPYLEGLIPPLSSGRLFALFCLLAPELVLDMARRTAGLRAQPQPSLVGLAPGDERNPAALFGAAWPDMAGLQREVLERAGISLDAATEARRHAAAQELSAALAGEPLAALGAIFAKTVDKHTNLAANNPAAQNMFLRDVQVQFALTGHTHLEGALRLPGNKLFLDTGTWTRRLFQAGKTELNEELLAWLHAPETGDTPLRDATRFTFVLLRADGHRPTTAQLCEWMGGWDGSYRPFPAAFPAEA